ncbi:MAG: hypothetical protein HS115_10235 [Spirochaetales bacterium]|nr:hypothetical protein [Spirochaetales bacterium]
MIKGLVLRFLDRIARAVAERLSQTRSHSGLAPLTDVYRRSMGIEQVAQKCLMEAFCSPGRQLHSVDFIREGFKAYSQNDEDGILLYIFSIIGEGSRRAAEICAGDGIECNSANLIINHGWRGLLVDGDRSRIDRGLTFYAKERRTRLMPPQLVQAWVTRENVNSLLSEHGMGGDLDLLSIDVDGNDYWLWDAITVANPRVVVVETNTIWGPTEALTIPYDPSFVCQLDTTTYEHYCGASLAAFVRLGRRKGYRLVGMERRGFNAFFMRDDLGQKSFPERSVEECCAVSPGGLRLDHPERNDRVEWIKKQPWQEVPV